MTPGRGKGESNKTLQFLIKVRRKISQPSNKPNKPVYIIVDISSHIYS